MIIMTIVTKAIYTNGVFKPTKYIPFSEQEKVCLVAVSQSEWKKQFSQLLKTVHRRTKKHSSSEIEKDITFAFNKKTKNK